MNFHLFKTQSNEGKGGWLWTGMLVLYILLSLMVSGVMQAVVPNGTNLNESVAYTAITGATSSIAILLVVIFACYFSRKEVSAKQAICVNKTHIIYYVAAILIAAGMLLGLGFVNGLIAEGFEGLGFTCPSLVLPLNNVWAYLLFVVVYAVMPAVCEELFFRGVLLRSFGKGADIKFSVIVTLSLCFALYHGSAVQLVYQLLYGVALCLLAVKAKSVLPAILAHFINNFAVLTLQFASISLDLYSPIIIAVGLILLAPGLSLTFIFSNKKGIATVAKSSSTIQQPNQSTSKKGNVISFWLSGGFIGGLICVMLILMGLLA